MEISIMRNISSQALKNQGFLTWRNTSRLSSCSAMSSIPEKTRLTINSLTLTTKYEPPVVAMVTVGCGVGGGLGGGAGFCRKCRKDGDSGNGSGSMDLHYQNMIEANPGNSMILSNYARFLSEIHGDVGKAKGYYVRALIANPDDGSVLSSYAELIWQADEDGKCAEGYFNQAVRASPDDSYVWASYARFLWDE